MRLNNENRTGWRAGTALGTAARALAIAAAVTLFGGLVSPSHALNPIMHNSSSVGSTKWGGSWGNSAGSKYGKFTCTTCHTAGLSGGNAKQVKPVVSTPDGSNWASTGTPNATVVFKTYTSYGKDTNHATSTSICEVCHSQTAHHKYNNTGAPNHNGAADCTAVCHPHSAGFKPAGGSCTSCHGNPPTVSTYGGSNGLATQSAYGGATNFLPSGQAGAHARHYTQLAMTCNACHTGYTASPMGSGQIEIGISISGTTWPQFTGPAVNYATYTGNSNKAAGYSYVGRNGTVLPATLVAGRNSCNVYCHGGWSGSGKSMRPDWTGAGTVVCGTCHGATAAAPPPRASHQKHAGNGTYTGYSISCTTCHPSRAAGNTAHITGSVQWQMSTGKAVVGANAKYNSAANGSTGALAPSASYASCTQVYCHSNGRATATYNTPTWGGASVANCIRCHGNSGATFRPMSSNAHRAHVNNTIAKFNGLRIACNECHNLVVYANTTSILSRTLHVNGAKNVDLKNGGTYSAGSCSSVYCHSKGTSPNTYVNPPNWQTTGDGTQGTKSCDMCHYGTVNDTNVQNSNKHAYHVPDSPASGFPHVALSCDKCHRYTVNGTGTAIITTSEGLHLNSQRDARFKAIVFTNRSGAYDSGANTCANTYCHGNTASGSWKTGPTKNCGVCHSTTNDGNMSAPHTKHYNSGTLVTKADGWTNTNGSTGTTNKFFCGTCHNTQTNHVNGPQVSGQGDAQVILNLSFGGGGDSVTKGGSPVANGRGYYYSAATTCSVYCHSNGRGKKRSPVWATGGVTCGSCHANGSVFYDWSSAHNKHLNTYKLGGSSINCYYCHSTTVNSTSTAIANTANHPNGTKTVVSSTFANFTWTAAVKRCSGGYCHSNGVDFTSPFTNTTSLSWTNKTTNCGSCHGASSTNPEPNYTSGSPKANSHGKHATGLNYQCVTCHSRVVDALRNISSHSLHVNQAYNVNSGGGFSFTLGNTPSPTTAASCTNISCHNNGSATWGGAARKCTDCHGTTGAEVVNYVQDGTGALINTTEWTYSGHGKGSGTYDVTANPAANFPGAAGTGDPCEYCHDKTLNHYDAANPLRLRNFTHATYGKSGVCLACHGTSGAGVDPDGAATVYANKTATKKIDKYHYGTQHSSSLNGGQFCWDCHDGHGDRINSTTGPIVMVQLNPAEASNATTGMPTTTAATAVSFTAKSAGSDFGKTASPWNGVCNVCHTYKAADPNKMVHYTKTSSDSHNSGTLCTNCHKHSSNTTFDNLAYKGESDCIKCHSAQLTKTKGTAGTIRQVSGPGGDFVRLSRHVSNGTATEIVTIWDCIVCHREGNKDSATGADDSSLHGGNGGSDSTGLVHLRNVDSPTTGWAINNKAALSETDRTNMDNFCLNCHDADGAAGINVNGTGTGLNQNNTRALTPWNPSDNRQNGRDGMTTRTRVIDVKTQFYAGTGGSGTGYNGNPSQHAVLGARYSTNNASWTSATWTNHTPRNSTQGAMNVIREKARLHCSDCHLSETNAHGAQNAWYMLLNGTANDYTSDTTMTSATAATYAAIVCYKCHASATYNAGTSGYAGSRVQHGVLDDNTFTDHAPAGDSAKLGANCLNCHGGDGYGRIHGRGNNTTDTDPTTYTPAGASSLYSKQRFVPGAWMKWSPVGTNTGTLNDADWNTTISAKAANQGCYFPASDNFANCGQHAGSTKTSTTNTLTGYGRPTKY